MSGAGRVTRAYARTVVRWRFVIVLGWVVVVIVTMQLPTVREGAPNFEGFVPSDSPTARTEATSVELFGFPLTSRTVLVRREEDKLSPYSQARVVLRAAALTQRLYDRQGPLVGGLPITNTLGLFPSSAEEGTTAVTYLFAGPDAGLRGRTEAARRWAEEHLGPGDGYVGVTGSIPARVAQARIVGDRIHVMEAATLAAIVGIVALYFRSLLAPGVALVTAGVGFFLALQVAARVGAAYDVTVPDDFQPLILALVLGIVTDYAIFFMAAMRRQLLAGDARLDAARAATASTGPIVAIAGFTVAAGTAVLLVAESQLFRAFGPGLAVTVGVAALVALTLVPALMAIVGRLLFWPSGLKPREGAPLAGATTQPLRNRRTAGVIAALCVIGLGAAAIPALNMKLGVAFVPSLPADTEVKQAGKAAAEGFTPGILSPSVLLVRGESIATQRDALTSLGERLERVPGVAGVLGPGDLPPTLERRMLTAPGADAVRYLIVMDDEPLGASAVETLQRLDDRVVAMGAAAGLVGAQYAFAGDTAFARELVAMTTDDLGRIAVAALVVNLLLLVLFLRALLAPVLLLASSVLALLASLGAMTWLFQDLLGHDGLTFYVPFASAVLLLSLGSDYNIFGVGYIWELARRMPLREAIAEAVPATSSAITVAGVTLAASFGMLALVPLRPFRELAFVLAVGILIDALIVRSVLVPALLSAVGPATTWPRHNRRAGREARDVRPGAETAWSPRDEDVPEAQRKRRIYDDKT
jgi:RND superfamily putative drug exporter